MYREIATPALGEALAKVMFSYRVYCDDPKIRSVIVCHGELKEEQSYPCTDGAAYIQLYTPDARILFEDEKRRRYATTVDYNLQKLMDEESYLEPCVTLDVTTPGFLLAVCQNDGKNRSPWKRWAVISTSYRCRNSRSLIAIRYAERS